MMALKATDLMLGDWVKYTTPPYIQVDNLTKRKIGYHTKPAENRMHYVRLCEVEPIPLTPEILERNGFRKLGFNNIENQHQWVWWSDTQTNVSLWCRELNDNPVEGWMIRIESYLVSNCHKVEHVHELQHALRLCGIEKEIEL